MGLVIDLILALIILVCVIISAKRGFVKVFIETVGFVAAVFLAFTISSSLANMVYDKIIEPPIVTAVAQNGTESAQEVVDKTFKSLPAFINNSLYDFSEKINEGISTNLQQDIEVTVKNASQQVIKPIITKILGLIFSVIIFVLLLIIVKLLARIINKLFSFSIVGTANRFLGGTLGLIKGLIFAVLFCMVISIIISTTDNGFLIFTKENIANSYLFKPITSINPFDILS